MILYDSLTFSRIFSVACKNLTRPGAWGGNLHQPARLRQQVKQQKHRLHELQQSLGRRASRASSASRALGGASKKSPEPLNPMAPVHALSSEGRFSEAKAGMKNGGNPWFFHGWILRILELFLGPELFWVWKCFEKSRKAENQRSREAKKQRNREAGKRRKAEKQASRAKRRSKETRKSRTTEKQRNWEPEFTKKKSKVEKHKFPPKIAIHCFFWFYG